SVIGMFVQDQYRDWKVEQRKFRDVESAIADRNALRALPQESEVKAAEEAVQQTAQTIDKKELEKLDRQLDDLLLKRVKSEAAYNKVKADFDSLTSLYNIAVDEKSPHVASLKNDLDKLRKDLHEKQDEKEGVEQESKAVENQRDKVRRPLTKALAE